MGLAGGAATDAVLLTSELVTNAVLHASGPAAVSLAVAEGTLEVGVSDPDPRPPVRRLPSIRNLVDQSRTPPWPALIRRCA